MNERSGRVFLVGAGPGAPDLIALRGRDVLSRADVVIYDHLVNSELLKLAPSSAELIYAGKKSGAEKSFPQAELNRMLIEHAQKGRVVVRLKGGDPFIFGRGGEEAEALARAQVPFEVVPGVTSAIAAAAFAGIPLTHREHGSFVVFVTGHEDENKGARSAIPWDELAAAAQSRGTIVILMATARMRATLARLSRAGLSSETPAVAIESATTAAQKTVAATLATLADECARAGLKSPAVIVVGECAGLRERLRWVEQTALFGRAIVITRAQANTPQFAAELRHLGAEVFEFPTIETVPPKSYQRLDAAIARVGSFDWIVFTSATGVEAFTARLRSLGRDIRSIGQASIAAIGPATAERLANYGLQVAAIPGEYRAEAIIDAIGIKRIRGKRFLIPRAEVAREALPELLREAGAREVVIAPAYRTIKPKGVQVERMRELIASRGIDLVTFTSSSTVINFCKLIGAAAKGLKAAAIGPITAETARRKGFEVVVTPAEYTIAELISAIQEYFEREAVVAGGGS
ncbi:MAG: uroporphyrinogen-III C-methyltransferase [Candidatus Binatus sp.]|uniref:uroporphyrinogen-III C-methyltransferase n=1 Tax=Candidatus Binatus sp. TaxID=2811406 RepID=UPI00271761FD|nr:uroporphyrinogen-III C-methyltransferase [Candidatus Binatus sp.]MDO8431807.1 uroporphyrinogen-III C-methyltransferase [Candidatus Binatus sp.]